MHVYLYISSSIDSNVQPRELITTRNIRFDVDFLYLHDLPATVPRQRLSRLVLLTSFALYLIKCMVSRILVRFLNWTKFAVLLFFLLLFFLFWPLLGSSNGRVKIKGKKKKKKKNFTTRFYIHESRASVWYAIPPNPLTFSSKIPISIHSFILYYTYLSDDVYLISSDLIQYYPLPPSPSPPPSLILCYKGQKEGRKEGIVMV